jgi:hypothetical protein
MMLAIFILMGTALLVAAFLIASSMSTPSEEAPAARLDAPPARWEPKVARDQLAAVRSDPRGIGDGLGQSPPLPGTGRFRRDVPAATPSHR